MKVETRQSTAKVEIMMKGDIDLLEWFLNYDFERQ